LSGNCLKRKLITIRFEVRIYIHMSSVRLLIALMYTDIEEKTFSFLSALYVFIRSLVYKGIKALKVLLLLFSTVSVSQTRVRDCLWDIRKRYWHYSPEQHKLQKVHHWSVQKSTKLTPNGFHDVEAHCMESIWKPHGGSATWNAFVVKKHIWEGSLTESLCSSCHLCRSGQLP
jgi:hypothetical protein